MCGIVAICGHPPVSVQLYDALTVLQHRGQDSAGIVTCDEAGHVYRHKGNGLVRDVFHAGHIEKLRGDFGIGHVRYPTAGTHEISEAQPFYVNSPYGIALGHNGNLVNSDTLVNELFAQDLRHINTGSDSEILLNVLAHELLMSRSLMLDPKQIFRAIRRVHERCLGAYAVVGLIAAGGVFGFRDPYGIRPIVYGKKEGPQGVEYMIASESVALDTAGFEKVRDLEPGEAVYITATGDFYTEKYNKGRYRSCIFEYVYFSRPDSMIDNVFVHKARMHMGNCLAEKIKREWADYDIDVVMPVPDTSRTAAFELASDLGVACREGFIKNRYIGRTFIMPQQQQRSRSVRQKLNPLGIEFQGKNVLLVDDSIVRGTTSREIVRMARDAGAKKVYFASASPPVRYPNVYGIDMPCLDELIAYQKSPQQVCDAIAADFLIYQDLRDLIKAVQVWNKKLRSFECSVFDGKYAHDLSKDYFRKLSERRNNATRRMVKDDVSCLT